MTEEKARKSDSKVKQKVVVYYRENATDVRWEKVSIDENGHESVCTVMEGTVTVLGEIQDGLNPIQVGTARTTSCGTLLVVCRKWNGQVRRTLAVETKADLQNTKRLSDALARHGLVFSGNDGGLIPALGEHIFRQSQIAGRIEVFAEAGRDARRGIVVARDGILIGGRWRECDLSGLIFEEDGTVLGVLIHRTSLPAQDGARPLFPRIPLIQELDDANPERLNSCFQTCLRLFGPMFPAFVALEAVNIVFLREMLGSVLSFAYVTGGTRQGKTLLLEAVGHVFWGWPLGAPESAGNSLPLVYDQLTNSGVGAILDEADKPGKAWCLANERFAGDVLTLAEGRPPSVKRVRRRVNGWLSFTGATVSTTNAQILNRLLVGAVPDKTDSGEKQALIENLVDGVIEMRRSGLRFMSDWSRDPLAMQECLLLSARQACDKMRNSGIRMETTSERTWSLVIAAWQAIFPMQGDLIWKSLDENWMTDSQAPLRPTLGFFENLAELFSVVGKQRDSYDLSLMNASVKRVYFPDADGVVMWKPDSHEVFISVGRGVALLKRHRALQEPISEKRIYGNLGLTGGKNDVEWSSSSCPWVRKCALKGRHLEGTGFNRISCLVFDLSCNDIPDEIRNALEVIVARIEPKECQRGGWYSVEGD